MIAPELGDIDTLARTLWGEARGEGRLGQRAVAHTIMNRAGDSRWPDSITKVCFQPYQFSCWNTSGDQSQRRKMLQMSFAQLRDSGCFLVAAEVALFGDQFDVTYGANHYLTTELLYGPNPPGWALPRDITAVIGHHTFLNIRKDALSEAA